MRNITVYCLYCKEKFIPIVKKQKYIPEKIEYYICPCRRVIMTDTMHEFYDGRAPFISSKISLAIPFLYS